MRKIALEFTLFGIGPLLIAFVCLFGLVGGLTKAEAFLPVYLIGLIFGITAAGIYGVAVLFRAIGWIVTNAR